jgi:hypothetical protein
VADSNSLPVVPATRHGQHLTVTCPWCGAPHHHSAGPRLGDGDGPRAPHCHQGGHYHLVEVSLT